MWKRVTQHEPLPLSRSSHSITVVGHTAYLFGGEHLPRQVCLLHHQLDQYSTASKAPTIDGLHSCRTPIDSQIHAFDLKTCHWQTLEASGDAPHPRVAHAAAAVGHSIFIFGGRSGVPWRSAPPASCPTATKRSVLSSSIVAKASRWARGRPTTSMPSTLAHHHGAASSAAAHPLRRAPSTPW